MSIINQQMQKVHTLPATLTNIIFISSLYFVIFVTIEL